MRKDGTLFWANVVMTPVQSDDGRLLGFAKVTRDMTERRKLEDLERSSRRMKEFLAMLAHELRNPLAPMRNAVSLLQIDNLRPDMLRKANAVMDRQITHMTRLVDDLLDVGRLSTGKVTLRKAPVDLREFLNASAEGLRGPVEARRHRLHLSLAGEPMLVNIDTVRINQVLNNLLVNAAKFTPEGGDVWLKAWRDGGFAFVSVRDNGRGLSREDTQRVFELFAQGEASETFSKEPGLGIGLTLARSLVEMHGGALDASSEGPGQGSTFTFSLPLAGAEAAT